MTETNDFETHPAASTTEPAPLSVSPVKKGIFSHVVFPISAIIVMVCAIGIAGYFFIGAQKSVQNSIAPSVVPAAPASDSPSPSGVSSATPEDIPDVSNADVFVPRNPFAVIASPSVASTDTPDAGHEDANTLTLLDITTVAGIRYAVIRLGGVTYTLSTGEAVGSSSWKVVTVHSNTVDLLYGDELVTVSIAGGFSK